VPDSPSLAFTSYPLDRAGHLRADSSAVARLQDHPDSRYLVLWQGKPLITAGNQIAWAGPDSPLLALPHPPAVFLGLLGEVAHFAVDISAWQPEIPPDPPAFFDLTRITHPSQAEGTGFVDLRAAMTLLSPSESAIAATAKGVLAWHEIHPFCARCGAASGVTHAGWQRKCPSCGAEHFPRTDPVVIMLITHGNDTLIGRNAAWPEGMYSCLAGFMEPGETIEAAVRREVFEETRVTVGPVTYRSSQPWPFPASLMIGCHGQALSRDITLDPVELQDAFWISRERLMHGLAGLDSQIKPSRPGTIARFLMESWIADR
jgi:NAD+ diphosphatase